MASTIDARSPSKRPPVDRAGARGLVRPVALVASIAPLASFASFALLAPHLGACGKKKTEDLSHPASARLVGTEALEGRCRYLVEVTAEGSLNEVVATVRAPGVLGRNFGPFERGERRILPIPGPRRRPCAAGSEARVTSTSPGQPPARFAASYGLLRHGTHDLAAPLGEARCVVVTALRVARPGPVAPSVTLYGARGRALETSAEDNACHGRAEAGLGVVYCATLARTPCGAVRRVVVTRGGAVWRGRLAQARLRVDRCDDVSLGRARVRPGGAPVPPWAGRPGTRAFLVTAKGAPLTYAHGVAVGGEGSLELLSPRAQPCTEASVLVLQRQEE